MKTIDELIMIIPVILNLKGNLEMNLSARLSTAANVGELDSPKSRRKIITGNLSLLQVQATVVSFVAACVSLLLGLLIPLISPFPESSPSPPPSNTTGPFNATALHFAMAVIHDTRRPRPQLPINDGKPKSGLAEYVFFLLPLERMLTSVLPGLSWLRQLRCRLPVCQVYY